MYFSNFDKMVYDFNIGGKVDYKVVTDITKNVRFRKEVLENVSLYDFYDIEEGDTPEIISEKVYGTPYYHWVVMISNQKYDYVKDFPLSQKELDEYIDTKYGDKKYHIKEYKKNNAVQDGVCNLTLKTIDGSSDFGPIAQARVLTSSNGYVSRIINLTNNMTSVFAEVSIRTGSFLKNEILSLSGTLYSYRVDQVSIPIEYIGVTNYDHEYRKNENKGRIRIISPSVIDKIVSEFKDLL